MIGEGLRLRAILSVIIDSKSVMYLLPELLEPKAFVEMPCCIIGLRCCKKDVLGPQGFQLL